MKKMEQLFNSDTLLIRAERLIEEVPVEERKQYLDHPLTQAILLTVQSDYLLYHEQWEGGGFTDQKADGTAQMNAKALGAIECLKSLANYIEDIPKDDTD